MSNEQKLPEVYTVEEIAAQLKAHPETIRRLIKKGSLRAFKLGGQWRIAVQEFQRYLESVGYKAA